MNVSLPLSKEKKLMVVFRIEPGCLGPKGHDHIKDFCHSAQKEVEEIDADFVHWELVPRNSKSQPEMQYQINHRDLSHDKAARYLQAFGKSLNEFEEHLHNKLTLLIDLYLGH